VHRLQGKKIASVVILALRYPPFRERWSAPRSKAPWYASIYNS